MKWKCKVVIGIDNECFISESGFKKSNKKNIVIIKSKLEEVDMFSDLVDFDKVFFFFCELFIVLSYCKCDLFVWYCFKSLF